LDDAEFSGVLRLHVSRALRQTRFAQDDIEREK